MLNFNWHPLLQLYTIVHTPFVPTYYEPYPNGSTAPNPSSNVFLGRACTILRYILQSTQQQTSDVSILLSSPHISSALLPSPLLRVTTSSASWIMTTRTNESATLSLHQRISSSLARTSRTRAAEASGRRQRKNEPSVSFSARHHLS